MNKNVERCFVIQPFDDGGEFDSRYKNIFAPAIEESGLEPYRIDNDKSKKIIDVIEEIKKSEICFAEISTDRPNVWFELGVAISNEVRDIVLACKKERKLPFDIQNYQVIFYDPDDTDRLKLDIVTKISATYFEHVENIKGIHGLADLAKQKDNTGFVGYKSGIAELKRDLANDSNAVLMRDFQWRKHLTATNPPRDWIQIKEFIGICTDCNNADKINFKTV